MTTIEKEIKNYAFLNNVDYDEATYKVMSRHLAETFKNSSFKGLYDKCFKEESK